MYVDTKYVRWCQLLDTGQFEFASAIGKTTLSALVEIAFELIDVRDKNTRTHVDVQQHVVTKEPTEIDYQ
jgi:hypothetical protein